jgi:hypothetical protein
MATDVKVNFRVTGAADLQRAFSTVTASAQRGAAAAARAQTTGATQASAARKKANSEMLSDAEALANAEIALIRRVNRARTEAAKEQVKLQAEAQAQLDRMTAAQERAARASNRRRAAGEIGSGAAAGFKAGAAIIGGAVGINAASALRDQMSLEERAALLRNASGKNQSQFDSIAQAKKISNLTGVSASEVMTGFEQLSGKAGGGGLVEYTKQYEQLAKVARGAGVSMADLGNTLGTLYNRGVKADSVVKVVEALVQQGKDGAVEFNQLATLLDASSGALGKFKMGDADRIMTAGGLSQFARTFGKKSAEESTNAVEDLARDLAGKADVIQKLTGGQLTRVTTKGTKTVRMVNGRKVETEVGGGTVDRYAGGVEVGTDTTRAQLRDINTLLPDIIEGVVKSGNAGKLMGEGGIFTGNGTAIAGPLLQAFTSGIKKNAEGRFELAKEGDKADVTGRAAVEAMLKQFQAADVAAGTSEKAFAEVMNSSNAKLNQQIETLKNEIGTKLGPVAQKAIENPKTAMAAILAGGTALGVANVGIGKLGGAMLDKIFPKAVGSMTVTAATVVVGGPGAVAAGAAASTSSAATTAAGSVGTAGKAGALATLGAVGAVAANVYGLYKVGEQASADTGAIARGDAGHALAAKIAGGGGTEADRDRAGVLAKQAEMMQGGFFGRMAGSALAMGDQMKQEGVSLASLGKMMALPFSMVGGAVKSGDAEAQSAQKSVGEELKAALSGQPLKLDPGASIQIANPDAIAAPIAEAVRAASLQGPKAQTE